MQHLQVNGHLQWPELQKILGWSTTNVVLPSDLDCPHCGTRRAAAYLDTLSHEGVWYHCQSCQQAGDGFDLMAALRRCSRAEAAELVWSSNVVSGLHRHWRSREQFLHAVQKAHELRLRIDRFWERCRSRWLEPTSITIERLCRRFRLHSTLSRQRFADGPGRWLGLSSAADAELLLRKRANRGFQRWFTGPGWDDVLVWAFESSFSRLSALGFIGRAGEPTDRVHKFLRRKTEMADGGLWGLSSILHDGDRFGGVVFAVADPLVGMRLQVRHAQTAGWPLPLVSWFDHGSIITRHSWANIRNRRVVFWGWELTPSLMAQAVYANGDIALVPLQDFRQERIDHYIRLQPPVELLHRALRRALPWPEAVRAWASQKTSEELGYWWRQLERYCLNRDELLRRLGERFEQIDQVPQTMRIIRRDKLELIERPDGWFYRRTDTARASEQLLCEARWAIERLILDGANSYYTGWIEWNGQRIAFEDPVQQVEEQTSQWLRRRCLEANLGRPRLGNLGNIRLVDVATSWRPIREIIRIVDPMDRHKSNPSPSVSN